MKKLFFMLPMLAALLMFTACSEDDDPNVSTFTIINNTEKLRPSLDEYLNGTMYEVIAFEYDENGNNIGQININDIPYGGGKSEPIQVQESCSKVQVSFRLVPRESPFYNLQENARLYIVSLGVIKKGGNINIIVDGETMSTTNPSVRSRANDNCIKFIDYLKFIQRNIF